VLRELDPSYSSSAVAAAVAIAFVCLALVGVALWTMVVLSRRRRVIETSTALKHLIALNGLWQPAVPSLTPITLDFPVRVNSKAKFDRFDLGTHLMYCLLDYEDWFEHEVRARVDSVVQFDLYKQEVAKLSSACLGRSRHPKVRQDVFTRTEAKLFAKRQLPAPVPAARITSTVSYVSPQGRNSYTGRLTWDFDQLRQGLRTAQAQRARKSTVQAQRQRERSLMTSTLRVSVLRRDNYRCRMCGASASDGVPLHIYHITPVSHGGRTDLGNLQTLCADCNLGKGNRFVG